MGTIIPSIASQLSEFAAFIVSNTYDGRLEEVKQFNELYNTRSSIAHGGSSSVTDDDVLKALEFVRNLITNLITRPEFSKMKTIGLSNKSIHLLHHKLPCFDVVATVLKT